MSVFVCVGISELARVTVEILVWSAVAAVRRVQLVTTGGSTVLYRFDNTTRLSMK
jgi:hypothetical protein